MAALTTADGRKLTYRELGDGPLLVCHPGGPGIPALIFDDLAGLDRDRTLIGSIRAAWATPTPPRRTGSRTMRRISTNFVRISASKRSTSSATPRAASCRSSTPRRVRCACGSSCSAGRSRASPTSRARSSGASSPSESRTGAWAVPELESGIRDTQVVVMPGIGHMPWVEDREGFRSAVLEFLS